MLGVVHVFDGTYPAEYLGGGFLDFPIVPLKADPNKLRRSLGLAPSRLLLGLLWLLGAGSSTELRLVEVRETGVEIVSLPPLLLLVGISPCVNSKSIYVKVER